MNSLVSFVFPFLSFNPSHSAFLDGVQFDYTSSETVNGQPMDIGWIKYFDCKEGEGSYDHAFRFNPNFVVIDEVYSELLDLRRWAVSTKILAKGDIPAQSETTSHAVTATICSNPVYALNNGYELSYLLDTTDSTIAALSDRANWEGSDEATERVINHSICGDKRVASHIGSVYKNGAWIGDEPLPLFETYFFACDSRGIHLNNRIQSTINSEDSWQCSWEYGVPFGYDVTVWLGFDAKKEQYCQHLNDGSYGLNTGAPTPSPTNKPTPVPTKPTSQPTAVPTKRPTPPPTGTPTLTPITTPYPTVYPTRAPTENPVRSTESPTENPTENPTKNPSGNPIASPTENPSAGATDNPTITTSQILRTQRDTDDNEVTEDSKTNTSPKSTMEQPSLIMIVIGAAALVLLMCLCIGVLVYVKKRNKTKMEQIGDNEEDEHEAQGWYGDATM